MLLALLLSPIAIALVVSGVGLKRGWRPDMLLRLLPLLVLVAVVALMWWLEHA